MKNENIVSMLERLVAEANALSEDQIVTTAFPNHPEKVAIWKKNMGIDVDDES